MSLIISLEKIQPCQIYYSNLTNNLAKMADAAGLYEMFWENKYKLAGQIVVKLKNAIKDMEKKPDYYKQFNSPNGHGIYEDFLLFLKDLLRTCEENPDAKIDIWG